MSVDDMDVSNLNVLYEPDEKPGWPLSTVLGLQTTVIMIAGVVVTPAVVVRAGGQGADYLGWAIFSALAISGLTTILQVTRAGRFGSGYMLIMGTSNAFIAVAIAALLSGGPVLLAMLILASSFIQFFLAYKLSWLRKFVTPSVTGTVVALIAVALYPIVSDLLSDVPESAPPHVAPVIGAATFFSILVISLLSSGMMRLWAPLIGIGIGCLLSFYYGVFDLSAAEHALWFGVPNPEAWPGLTLDLPASFWILLPSFMFVTLIGAIETVGDAVTVQRMSHRKPKTIDFKSIQGAVSADGLGNLLSGLAGTVPNTTYSASIAMVEITGIAARRVGLCVGIAITALAFFPKLTYLFAYIPGPVAGGYLLVTLGILMIQGMKLVLHKNRDNRSVTIAGMSILIGIGFQYGLIFPELVTENLEEILGNGMTIGGLVALALTAMLEFTASRRRYLQVPLQPESEPLIVDFLHEMGSNFKWDEKSIGRLCSVGGETLIALLESTPTSSESADDIMVRVSARKDHGAIELEFVSGSAETNFEDQLAIMEGQSDMVDEDQLSLKIISRFSSSIKHHQYHGLDIMTMRVERVSAAPS